MPDSSALVMHRQAALTVPLSLGVGVTSHSPHWQDLSEQMCAQQEIAKIYKTVTKTGYFPMAYELTLEAHRTIVQSAAPE